jgi:acetylornithine deacetylase
MVEKLLKKLIKIPSVSGKEKKIAKFVFDYLKNNGLRPKLLFGNNVYCETGKGKRTLLLNSHLDTVPPSSSWTMEPYHAKIMNGKIYGLGACDTKGNLAAMTEAMVDLNKSKEKLKGKVIFAATDDEEDTGPSGMEKLAKKLKFDAIIIGEPTDLNICIAEKGLLRLKIKSKGKAAHAAIGAKEFNAIYKAAKDINILNKINFKKKHKFLGYPSIQVTTINGGIAKNMIPDFCEFILDIRTNPIYPNNYLLNLIKKKITSKIEIVSNRIFSKETNVKEKIVQAAEKATPNSKIAGFLAVSDFAFVQKPGIILGAGSLEQAHSANEFVEIPQIKKIKEIYKKVIENYF